jgi:N6-L-threonylcarbamoyladenine synthase
MRSYGALNKTMRKSSMLVLGIESSCDDCAAAIVEDGQKILSHAIYSQVDTHRGYGGVVPELASREHLKKIIPVIEEALKDADLSLKEINGIAVTYGPGLVGSLLVGLSAAKALSFALDIPFYGVNHLEGHLMAIFLEEKHPTFPFLGLVVSGGHTSLYEVHSYGTYRLLGQTRDDAAGESFDKVAKLLGLGYPGGIIIDQLAHQGNPSAFTFPRAMPSQDILDFSFSGLKTAVYYFVRKHGEQFVRERLNDIVASFQEAVVDTLLSKTFLAASSHGIKNVVVSGGVAANSRLRKRLIEEAGEANLRVYFPSPFLCTDNSAMIASVGHYYLSQGKSSPLDLNAEADLCL